jgi:(E)-4-hydroxy-3-methylbut-2-enyl-diphosphate synthase
MTSKTHTVQIGNPANGGIVKIGGGLKNTQKNPVAIQSMTNTDTADVKATVAQIIALCDAGSEMVRITVNNFNAAKAVPVIKKRLLMKGYSQPLIGDFHFNGHILLKKYPDCAKALDKYRINPGNVGVKAQEDQNFTAMIRTAIRYKKPVRIGVNWGSLDQNILTKLMDKNARQKHPRTPEEITRDAVVRSALDSAKVAEKLGLPADKIVLSVKMSDVQDVIAAYEKISSLCDYALHLGLTEAGGGDKGLIASTSALAILLQKGIGDTIRISLTPAPVPTHPRSSLLTPRISFHTVSAPDPRTREVEACQLLLQTMGLRNFRPLVTSCPGCGRTANNLHQKIAAEVTAYISLKLPVWQKKLSYGPFKKLTSFKIAVMGCVVNGPGESSHADIAISLPGKTEKPVAQVYIKGKPFKSLKGAKIAKEFIKILDNHISKISANI